MAARGKFSGGNQVSLRRSLHPVLVASCVLFACPPCFADQVGGGLIDAAKPVASQPASTSPDAGSAIPVRYRYRMDAQRIVVLQERNTESSAVASLEVEGLLRQMIEHGPILFVAADTQGVAIVDVSTPTQPVLRGYIGQGQPVLRLGIAGATLIAGLASGQSLYFDIANPARPIFRGSSALQPPATTAGTQRGARDDDDDDEPPRTPRVRDKGRPGLGLTITGASMLGAGWLFGLAFAYYNPKLAVPVVGPVIAVGTASSGWDWAWPMCVLWSVEQAVGAGLLVGGVVKMSNAPTNSNSVTSSLTITPFVDRNSVGFVSLGRF